MSEQRRGPYTTIKPRGDFLCRLRTTRGVLQSEVERKAGLPEARLYHYEKGRPVSIEHLKLLAAYYGLPARDLVEPESVEAMLSLSQELQQIFRWTANELTNGIK